MEEIFMRKIINASIIAVIFFVILNFIYCNLNEEVFNYEVNFIFSIPHLFTLKSVPLPLGFILILAFSLGVIFLAALQALPALFRTGAMKARDKKIKMLEKELEEARLHGDQDTLNGPPVDSLPPGNE